MTALHVLHDEHEVALLSQLGVTACAAGDARLPQLARDAGAVVVVDPRDRGLTELLEAVAANRDPALAARTLALSIAPPTGTASVPSLGSAEAFELPERVARASPHAALAYAHAVMHFDALMKQVEGAGWGEREGLLPDIASRLSTRAQAEQLLRDQQRLAGPNGAVNAQRAVQEIALRVRWREAQGEALQGVLQAR